jgi:hypothetical protein
MKILFTYEFHLQADLIKIGTDELTKHGFPVPSKSTWYRIMNEGTSKTYSYITVKSAGKIGTAVVARPSEILEAQIANLVISDTNFHNSDEDVIMRMSRAREDYENAVMSYNSYFTPEKLALPEFLCLRDRRSMEDLPTRSQFATFFSEFSDLQSTSNSPMRSSPRVFVESLRINGWRKIQHLTTRAREFLLIKKNNLQNLYLEWCRERNVHYDRNYVERLDTAFYSYQDCYILHTDV